MADQVITVEPEFILCIFFECLHLPKILNFWLSVIYIQNTVGLWRMDFEHALW